MGRIACGWTTYKVTVRVQSLLTAYSPALVFFFPNGSFRRTSQTLAKKIENKNRPEAKCDANGKGCLLASALKVCLYRSRMKLKPTQLNSHQVQENQASIGLEYNPRQGLRILTLGTSGAAGCSLLQEGSSREPRADSWGLKEQFHGGNITKDCSRKEKRKDLHAASSIH